MREGECFVPLPLAPNGSGSSTSATVAPSPGRPSAAEFTPERLLRPAAIAPNTGWRRLLYRATGGSLNPGISQGEARRNQLLARAKTPIAGCRRIAVISCKGGIGKTTTTLMLGHTFAIYRGDRVVALDANPDAGSLGYRVRRQTTATVADLLKEAEGTARYSDVRSYTSQAPARLEVIVAAADPRVELLPGGARCARASLQPHPLRHRHGDHRRRYAGDPEPRRPDRALRLREHRRVARLQPHPPTPWRSWWHRGGLGSRGARRGL